MRRLRLLTCRARHHTIAYYHPFFGTIRTHPICITCWRKAKYRLW